MRESFKGFNSKFRLSFLRFRAVTRIPSALAICVVLLASVATETITDLISTFWGRIALMVALIVASAFFFLKWEVPFRKDDSSFGQVDNSKLAHRRGLVIMVGYTGAKPDSAVAKLLRKARGAEMIALVTTPEVAAKDIPSSIRDTLVPAAGLKIAPSNIRVWDQAKAEGVAGSNAAVTDAITWMLSEGLTPHEVVVDISEGRRAMHFGAFSAAVDLMVEVQYLGPDWDPINDKPLEGTEVFKVVSEIY